MDLTLPPVQHAMMAWPNSWKAITSIYPCQYCDYLHFLLYFFPSIEKR